MPLGDPSPRSTLPPLRTVFCGDSLREARKAGTTAPRPPLPGIPRGPRAIPRPGRPRHPQAGPGEAVPRPQRSPGCPIPARRSAVPGASAPAGLHRSYTAPGQHPPPSPCSPLADRASGVTGHSRTPSGRALAASSPDAIREVGVLAILPAVWLRPVVGGRCRHPRSTLR